MRYFAILEGEISHHETLEDAVADVESFLEDLEGEEPGLTGVGQLTHAAHEVGLAPCVPGGEFDYWRKLRLVSCDAPPESDPQVLFDWALIHDWLEWALEEREGHEDVIALAGRFGSGERTVRLGQAFMALGAELRRPSDRWEDPQPGDASAELQEAQVPAPPPEAPRAEVIDLMAALKASLARVETP